MEKINHATHMKTIFCDIDGCVFYHYGNIKQIMSEEASILPGVQEKFYEWHNQGYTIILTTGRPESLRNFTEKELCKFGLFYNQLIMNLPRGQRIIINDIKPKSKEKMAVAFNLKRNKGMKNVDI